MACNAYMYLPGVTTQQYDQVNEKAGITRDKLPEKLISHMAFEQGGGLHISDLRESQQDFEQFFGPLAGLAQDVVGNPVNAQPKFAEVYNYFINSRA